MVPQVERDWNAHYNWQHRDYWQNKENTLTFLSNRLKMDYISQVSLLSMWKVMFFVFFVSNCSTALNIMNVLIK